MQIVRVYSGDEGESHFEDVSPEEMVEVAKRLGEGDIQLNARPAPGGREGGGRCLNARPAPGGPGVPYICFALRTRPPPIPPRPGQGQAGPALTASPPAPITGRWLISYGLWIFQEIPCSQLEEYS